MKLQAHPHGLAVIEPEHCSQLWTLEDLAAAGFVPKERAEKAERDRDQAYQDRSQALALCDRMQSENLRLQSSAATTWARATEAQRLSDQQRHHWSLSSEWPLVTAEALPRRVGVYGALGCEGEGGEAMRADLQFSGCPSCELAVEFVWFLQEMLRSLCLRGGGP